MKKLYTTIKALSHKNAYRFLIMTTLLISTVYSSYGQVRVPFTPRASNIPPSNSSYTIKGDFAMIGNTNMTMVNYSDGGSNFDDVQYVDIDGLAIPGNTTFNSSSATLNFSTENGAIPECSNILYAGLYWTGRAFGDDETDSDVFDVTLNGVTKTFDKRKVSLKGPGASSYTEVTAGLSDIYYPSGTDGNMYSAYVEVTEYVQQNGIGEYFVADIASREGNADGTGFYAGWGMVVVYENTNMRWRDITVFDGHAYVVNGNASHTLNASGFNAVQNGDVNLKLGVMAGEGDVPWTGDFFEIEQRNTGTYQTLSHSNNATNNFFNSSIVTGNARNPNLLNNTGVDIAMFDIDNTGNAIIDNNQTSTSFRYGSTLDTYVIFNITFSVDAYIPAPDGILANTSINGNPPGGTNTSLEPSETADYTIQIKNSGSEATDNTVITIELSESIDPSNLNISSNTFPPFSTTNTPAFDPNVGSNGGIVWDLGTLPIPNNPDDTLAELSFSVTVTTDCSILTAPGFDPNVTISGMISGEGATSQLPFSFDLIQGFETSGVCVGNPISGPSIIPIEFLDYVNEAPVITAPSPLEIEGCDENDITALNARYPFSAVPSEDIKDTYVTTGYTVSDNGSIVSITYTDVVTPDSSCPTVITRTYTATDDCGNTSNALQEIRLTPSLITFTNPTDNNVASCNFDDQDEVNTAFTNWVAAQTTAIAPANGCTPVLTNDSASLSAPVLCDGGTTTVTWTITDLCQTINISADFNLTAPVDITFTNPTDNNVASCNFDDQDEVNTAFTNWVAAQTTAIAPANGCTPVLTNDSASLSAPVLCDGGTTTVTWTITDLCQTINVTADFNLTAPAAIAFTDPTDDASSAAEFDDPDSTVAQSNLDNDIIAWVNAQTATINGSLTGGCTPAVSNDFTTPSITFCASDSMTITWTITDLCNTLTRTATYTFTQPDGINFTDPVGRTVDTCDFDNDDPVIAQNNLNDDIAAWVNDQTDIINNSLTGGSPVVSHDFTNQSITLCDGGNLTITWTIADICETLTRTATYIVNAPVDIAFTNPVDNNVESCNFDDQDEVNTAFTNWVAAQTTAIAPTNGCTPVLTNDSASLSAPVLCDGGTTTVTWTITDLCQTINISADFNLTAPVDITFTNPTDNNVASCNFDDQDEVNTAFTNWVAAQTTAIAPANGCTPVLTNDSASLSAPVLCDGGTTTVTWTITDLCQTINISADFNLTAPVDITFTNPTDNNVESCNFDDQDEVNTAFTNWVAAQTTAIAPANGCTPVLTNDSASLSAPVLCDGGTTTVTWTITDLCQTINVTADFNLTAPAAIAFTDPTDDASSAAEFDDPDSAVAQSNLDNDIIAWVNAQTATINGSLTGGCTPIVSNDFTTPSITFCASDSMTITWTITDLCNTLTRTATYTFTQPDGINFTDPVGRTVDTCDFDNDDPVIAQNNLNDDIAAWVNAQTNIINNSLTGGSPVVSHDFTNQSITLCDGGNLTITWTIADICETLTRTATYIVNAPVDIAFTNPVDNNVESCNFDDQDEVNTAFTNWVAAQTTAIAPTNGCTPVLTDDSASLSAPVLCDGGTTTVTWTITDLCQTINISADFNLTAPVDITFTNPTDNNVASCNFDDQDEVNTAFTNWVAAQTTAIAPANGCTPVLTNDSASLSAPVLCDGGTTTVTWTITDLCQTINISADFNLTAPVDITFTNPTDNNVESCNFDDQDEVNTAFTNWVAAQTTAIAPANGCTPVLTNDSASLSAPVLCDGGTTTVTWTISDLCQTINVTADFNLTAPVAIAFTDPTDDASSAAEFDDPDSTVAQSNLDNDIIAWVNAQTATINGSLTGGCTLAVSNDFTTPSITFCASDSMTITWTITDLCNTLTRTATYTFTQPDGISFTDPVGRTVDTCDFDNDDPVIAQNNLNDDIAAWVNAQTDIINNSITGGSPVVSHDFTNQSITLCDGGNLTITWTAEDICETVTRTATYIVSAPDSISFTDPVNDASVASEFDDPDSNVAQSNLDNDIDAWVNTQTAAITNSLSGGCTPVVTNDFTNQSIDFCTGGNISITWTITDLCETLTRSATYTFMQPERIDFTSPIGKTVETCDFDNDDLTVAQSNLDADIVAWVDAQTDIITNSLTGGSPDVNHDFSGQTINLCTGGSITVTWTVDDICETIARSAAYIVNPPASFTISDVQDETVSACDFEDQAALDIAFQNWVSGFGTSGGCNPETTDLSNLTAPLLCDGGMVEVIYNVTGLCNNGQDAATFTVNAPTPITFNEADLPDDATVQCDNVPDAPELSASTSCSNVSVVFSESRRDGNCPYTYELIRIWTATDGCGTNISHRQMITVQDTEAPVPTTTFDQTLNVSCTEIPDTPELTFTDNCSANIIVVFNEVNTFDENVFEDYEIVRTWTVRDECNNEETYTQNIQVALDEVITEVVAPDWCYDEGVINMNNHLPSDINTNGTWELLEGDPMATLNGSIFDPTNLELSLDFLPESGGIDYKFMYTTTHEGCISITEVVMNVHADCVVLPCGESDITISKAVTPNTDSRNEFFYISGIELCGFTAEVKIFNRWGALVFKSDAYPIASAEDILKNELPGTWDGKAHNASIGTAGKVPNGTYYYIINLKNSGLNPITGPVYLGTK